VGHQPMIARMPFITPEGLAHAQSFEARPSDVLIATYPKTGTTWMQQVCHQLRTAGHLEFDEISEERIVPWLEVGPSLGIDINSEQVAEPRVFKSHQSPSRLGHMSAKLLCVLRDPEATLLSNFKFMISKGKPSTPHDVNDFARGRQWLMDSDATLKSEAAEDALTFGSCLFQFYAEVWKCRELENVHVVTYEDMRKDLGSLLPGIAAFLGLEPLSKECHEKVMELSSFKWMKANDHLFDDHHMATRLATLGGKGGGKGGNRPSHVRSSKVGLQVGDDVNTTVTDDTRMLLHTMWQKHVMPITGHATYADMAAKLAGGSS